MSVSVFICTFASKLFKTSSISSLDDFYLEIGCGKGDFIVQMAEKFPERKFLGIEKNVTIPAIKIGDGRAYVQDLPFVNDDLRD